MKQSYLSVVALLLALWGSAQSQCNLKGTWTNQLLSNMTISSVDSSGQVSGVYLTHASLTNRTIIESPLSGFQQMSNSPTIGFSVRWKFSDSITSWAGQCVSDEQGQQLLVTMWLLREEEAALEDNWKSTRVGQDVFWRNP